MKTRPRIVIAFALACACALAGCNGGVEQTSSGVIEGGDCHVGRCSNELCSDKTGVNSPMYLQAQIRMLHHRDLRAPAE